MVTEFEVTMPDVGADIGDWEDVGECGSAVREFIPPRDDTEAAHVWTPGVGWHWKVTVDEESTCDTSSLPTREAAKYEADACILARLMGMDW